MMPIILRKAALILGALHLFALSGCTTVGNTPGAVDLYDLGSAQPNAEALPIALGDIEVRAPSWLGRSAMQYRLEYEQPAQRRVYTQSRWVSPPAEMLETFLDRAFAQEAVSNADRAGAPPCRLRIELDDFLQTFSAVDHGEGVILARAELLPSRGEQRLATHLITIREPAPSPDAPGGVRAHRVAAVKMAADLASWLQTLVTHSTSLAARCR